MPDAERERMLGLVKNVTDYINFPGIRSCMVRWIREADMQFFPLCSNALTYGHSWRLPGQVDEWLSLRQGRASDNKNDRGCYCTLG